MDFADLLSMKSIYIYSIKEVYKQRSIYIYLKNSEEIFSIESKVVQNTKTIVIFEPSAMQQHIIAEVNMRTCSARVYDLFNNTSDL